MRRIDRLNKKFEKGDVASCMYIFVNLNNKEKAIDVNLNKKKFTRGAGVQPPKKKRTTTTENGDKMAAAFASRAVLPTFFDMNRLFILLKA